ncbi:DUF4232 domain-containing protein [Jatrophihabitans sp.]|uniref:DUF4232 domain-containing protein n=1 Tax=Jatrophihabitans sp. TaxID=1932789 RepID=UPI002B98A7AD|nr:DUF4232 domain-containing protein [Jatrophihabitans sp.]
MTARTLTDELRSVLLFHALEAPEPNATVDRILNDTVGAQTLLGGDRLPAAVPARTGRRVSTQQLVAASVVALLLLAVAGINSYRTRGVDERNQSGNQVAGAAFGAASTTGRRPAAGQTPVEGSAVLPGTATDQANAKAAPPLTPVYAGKALDCATIRGSRLVTGQWDDYVSSTGELYYIFEFLCVGFNGERSASELQVFQQVDGQLKYRRTLLSPAADEYLDFMTAGADSARIQAIAHRQGPDRPAGAVLSTTWDLSQADPGNGYSFTVADPCGRTDLDQDLAVTATLSVVPDAPAPAWRLTVRNAGSQACGLEGFPVVRAQRAGATLATALPTLSGPVGGVTKQTVPPILVLPAGRTATALVEQSAAAAGTCQSSDQLSVTLPNGVTLSPLPARVSACGLIVHPLVENPSGSD